MKKQPKESHELGEPGVEPVVEALKGIGNNYLLFTRAGLSHEEFFAHCLDHRERPAYIIGRAYVNGELDVDDVKEFAETVEILARVASDLSARALLALDEKNREWAKSWGVDMGGIVRIPRELIDFSRLVSGLNVSPKGSRAFARLRSGLQAIVDRGVTVSDGVPVTRLRESGACPSKLPQYEASGGETPYQKSKRLNINLTTKQVRDLACNLGSETERAWFRVEGRLVYMTDVLDEWDRWDRIKSVVGGARKLLVPASELLVIKSRQAVTRE